MVHRIRHYVYAGSELIPRTATMRGAWGCEAKCSCGWQTSTGGAVRSYIGRLVEEHKDDAAREEERALVLAELCAAAAELKRDGVLYDPTDTEIVSAAAEVANRRPPWPMLTDERARIVRSWEQEREEA